jgi:endonuclease-3
MHDDPARAVYAVLFHEYCTHPRENRNFLRFENPFQILILTILSAQTTDAIVNSVAGALFSAYPTPEALARADVRDVEKIIRKCGFFHTKARNIIATAVLLRDEFGGQVPGSMADLLRLPGVGRKTANIVLNHAFGINEGIAVDTHVRRVAHRIGLTDHTDPDRIERDLMERFAKAQWGDINYLLIRHGRTRCTAKRPKCDDCVINHLCRYYRRILSDRTRQQ